MKRRRIPWFDRSVRIWAAFIRRTLAATAILHTVITIIIGMEGMTAIITSRMACLMVITRLDHTASRTMEATKHEGRCAPFIFNMKMANKSVVQTRS
ncbi:hypothetical protein N231_10490 [Geobacillus stearothermophilus ATCC 12980]|nr:hypothetical protein AA905_10920 [Geobacillus stearothermophilus]KMY60814.1 hypothetical protein AA904_08570 [Geobacillus stearothermophilus]KOR93809.1 hypothetical protein N231_10490 [Geobacillus stearothermophilus ATCC 12980]